MSVDKGRVASIMKLAHAKAWKLIQDDLKTTDKDLLPAVMKLRPHKAKLARVTPELLSKGLELVTIKPTGDDDADAKAALVQLVKRLESMLPMLGMLG